MLKKYVVLKNIDYQIHKKYIAIKKDEYISLIFIKY